MFRMDEGQARFWDSFCKVVGMIGIILGGGWTVVTYLQNAKIAAEAAAREAQKPFLDKRLELYIQAVSSVATIGTSSNPKDIAEAKINFWNLNWGPLALVEDEEVQNKMDAVAQCLRKKPQCEAKEIRELAENLAHSCKKSISSEWGVTLAPGKPTIEPAPDHP